MHALLAALDGDQQVIDSDDRQGEGSGPDLWGKREVKVEVEEEVGVWPTSRA